LRSLSRQERLVLLSFGGLIVLGTGTLLYSWLNPEVTRDLIAPWTLARGANPSAREDEPSSGLGNCALKAHLQEVEREIESSDRGCPGEMAAPVRRININTAAEGDLVLLEGIGPVRAKAIVEYRRVHGAFGSVEEVLEVRGIGPATLNRIRDWICAGEKNQEVGGTGG
jgi:comEA protein